MFDPFLLVTVLVILTLITVLVAAHELGHYLFARLFGMGVEEFAIGFGPKPIWTWLKKTYRVDDRRQTATSTNSHADSRDPNQGVETTNFTIRPLPIGGFVRIKGMVPEEDGSEVRVPGGFYSKAPWQRVVVLLMGPVFSILAGFAVLVPLLLISGGPPTGRPIFGEVLAEKPAGKAGIKAGDKVLSIDGKPVHNWYDLVSSVRFHGSEPVLFEIERGGRKLTASVAPVLNDKATPILDKDLNPGPEMKRQWVIGARPEAKKLTFAEAALVAASMPVKMVESLAGVVRQPSKFKEEVGGPIAIAQAADTTAREGLGSVITFAGLLSISLGIFNLLPIGFLDGGQIVVAFVEWARRGRRLSFRVQNWIAGVGFVMVMALFFSAIAVDISRIFRPAKQPGITKPEGERSIPPPTR